VGDVVQVRWEKGHRELTVTDIAYPD